MESLLNQKASGREQKSLGGSSFKTFGWRAFMAISGRLGLCGKLTGTLNCVGINLRIDLFGKMSRAFICLR
jgi:hypothetical protein